MKGGETVAPGPPEVLSPLPALPEAEPQLRDVPGSPGVEVPIPISQMLRAFLGPGGTSSHSHIASQGQS